MKKIISIVTSALLMMAMVGCNTTSTSSETYNGITRKITETTKDGKTTKTTEYTDEDGNVLSEKEGKAAFEKAKAETEE